MTKWLLSSAWPAVDRAVGAATHSGRGAALAVGDRVWPVADACLGEVWEEAVRELLGGRYGPTGTLIRVVCAVVLLPFPSGRHLRHQMEYKP